MSQVFLQQSKTVTRVVELYGVDGEGVSQPVGTDTVHPTCLGVNQLRQSRPFGTLSHYLPGSVPIYAEDEYLAFSWDWPTPPDVIP